MKRSLKKGSAVYQYLQSTGLLEHGTAEEIAAAKNLYWANIRKVWKQQHRSDYISYTIFFTVKEQRLFQHAATSSRMSINKLIKNSCIQTLSDVPVADKSSIGKIREALALFHTELENIQNTQHELSSVLTTLLNHFTIVEITVLSLLLNTKLPSSVD